VRFQTHECPQSQDDIALLDLCASHLRPLHTTALLQLAVAVLDGEHLEGRAVRQPPSSSPSPHLQAIGGPVLHVTAGSDCPKHSNEAEAFEANRVPIGKNVNACDGNIARFFWIARVARVHLAVALEARQEVPAMPAHRLEVCQAAVPAVEADVLRAVPTLFIR